MDDDNLWAPQHLRLTLAAIEGKAFAFAPRMLIDEDSGEAIGEDIWDSVGPHKGRLAAEGGFVDPNCLLIDKFAIGSLLGRWAETAPGAPKDCADRWFFAGIRDLPYAATTQPTVKYKVRRTNVLRRLALENRSALST